MKARTIESDGISCVGLLVSLLVFGATYSGYNQGVGYHTNMTCANAVWQDECNVDVGYCDGDCDLHDYPQQQCNDGGPGCTVLLYHRVAVGTLTPGTCVVGGMGCTCQQSPIQHPNVQTNCS